MLVNIDNNRPIKRENIEYRKALAEALSALANRGDFNYDASLDPQYINHAARLRLLGKRAMQDSLGEATALTGGYLNSYAQGLAQQKYAQNLNEVDNIIPKLYSMAFERFKEKGNSLQRDINNYESIIKSDDDDYAKEMLNWQKDRAYYLNKHKIEEQLALQREKLNKIEEKANSSHGGSSGKSITGSAGRGIKAPQSTVAKPISKPISTFEKLLRRFERQR